MSTVKIEIKYNNHSGSYVSVDGKLAYSTPILPKTLKENIERLIDLLDVENTEVIIKE